MNPLQPDKRYLFPDDYMADPSVHVYNGKIYIYPSHDWECENVENDNGDQYVMKDMHVLSIDGDPMTGKVTDHGKALDIADSSGTATAPKKTDVTTSTFPSKTKTTSSASE